MSKKSPYDQWADMLAYVDRRVYELTKGAPPEFNAAPVRQLAIDAYRLGYEVVQKERAPARVNTRLAEAERDAKRYRWLRDTPAPGCCLAIILIETDKSLGFSVREIPADMCDAMIDAAMDAALDTQDNPTEDA